MENEFVLKADYTKPILNKAIPTIISVYMEVGSIINKDIFPKRKGIIKLRSKVWILEVHSFPFCREVINSERKLEKWRKKFSEDYEETARVYSLELTPDLNYIVTGIDIWNS